MTAPAGFSPSCATQLDGVHFGYSKGEGPEHRVPQEGDMQFENMSLMQLEAHVGMAAQGIDAAIENGEDVQQARDYYAAALHAYRMRSN